MKTVTPLEKEIAYLGIPNAALYSHERRPADTRAILRGGGAAAEQYGPSLLRDPRYRAADRPTRRLALKELLSRTRAHGLSELPQERQKGIQVRRKSPEIQEILRRRGMGG